MHGPYIAWLERHGVPLYRGHDIYWVRYNRGLTPASPTPCFVELTRGEGKALLRESGAWFLQYASNPGEEETDWWYILCDHYDPKNLSSNTRSKISRGKRNCSVKRVEAEWLVEHGYSCYLAAYSRYNNATPATEEGFRGQMLRTIGAPFEHWGVFVGEKIAGYCRCIVEEHDVATSVIKFDPAYLRHYSPYALMSGLINHYVVNRGLVINNGTRSIAHDTNFQDLLLKVGFRKQFAKLNVIYPPLVNAAIHTLFPFRKLVTRLADRTPLYKLRMLFFQEEINRLCH